MWIAKILLTSSRLESPTSKELLTNHECIACYEIEHSCVWDEVRNNDKGGGKKIACLQIKAARKFSRKRGGSIAWWRFLAWPHREACIHELRKSRDDSKNKAVSRHIEKAEKFHVDRKRRRDEGIEEFGTNRRESSTRKDPIQGKKDRELREEESETCKWMYTFFFVQREDSLRLLLSLILIFLFDLFYIRSDLFHRHLRLDSAA